VSLTEHELDRLADYTVDVLEPDEAAAVSHLIETDPRWAAAYRSLVAADVTIRADLGTLGATPEPMPADVAARIDRALTDLVPRSNDLASRSNVIPIGQARGRVGRRTKVLGWLAGAAAAAAAVVGGVAALTQGATQFATTTSGAPAAERGSAADAAQPQAAPAGQPLPSVSGSRVVATNTDYQLDTLGGLASADFAAAAAGSGAAPAAGAVSDSTTKNNPQMADQAVAPLAALTSPTTLDSCLEAVLASHPGTVTLLDYARYLGRPALAIVVRQAAGTVVVAVGEKCGIAGADEKAAVPGK
jgi:hypothetical protein